MSDVAVTLILSGRVIVFDRPRFGQYVEVNGVWKHPMFIDPLKWATSGHGRGVMWTVAP